MIKIKTNSPEETFAFAKGLADLLKNGVVLCLKGDLGAGKTLFVQGLAKGFQVEEEVTSPTFSLMNVYHGRRAIYHFDLYRLESAEELYDIGFYEYTTLEDSIVIIEWPDKFPEELPEEYLWLEITRTENIDERLITIQLKGESYRQIYEELKQNCQF
ncbi:tRNA (adenosine(37)-N6)-threonylcarbamoyltransferase complex ATPase subunit type 1 TsaE [Anaerosinus gibii]|uniref:tRNA threonylcarbamoyladenosine biosynthesis protein TsaE n=1 Tax=Selenobaculum gibii TaxID=3054208 RepID=A0A9Y2AKX6_9FIRM|nr:tRNA (adenosine(37)-N6)-threonylcarbamoyltransferase complex ATPase subunit type 1 TsaE [Selenobaculum gbiensis]WIW71505.1 tRNA (adenosine(37)-N6)-threonylcarbamoyltransferase complex ATPase subunit type 1 TsaE [Selenobaculum gbiensis]